MTQDKWIIHIEYTFAPSQMVSHDAVESLYWISLHEPNWKNWLWTEITMNLFENFSAVLPKLDSQRFQWTLWRQIIVKDANESFIQVCSQVCFGSVSWLW